MAGKGKKILGVLILLLIIILLPILIFGGIYSLNEDFRLEANRVLRDAPGPVGAYFEKKPTEDEKQTQIMEIAMYMLEIDRLRAVDKLEKIKVEDQGLYENIVKYMIRDNPNRTKDILDVIRKNELEEDLILKTVNEIEEEVNEELKSDAQELLNLTLPLAKEKMESIIKKSINGHLLLSDILKNLEEDSIAKLVDVLENDDFNKVMNYFSKDLQEKIKKNISKKRSRKNDLNSLINIYKSKPADYLSTILIPDADYTLEELVYIYEGLGPKLSGEILSEMKNEEFNVKLISKIKEDQILKKGEDKLSEEILKSFKIFSEYDDNISELTDIYKTMEPQKVANTLEEMMRSSEMPEVYTIGGDEQISIDNEDIAIEVLNNFNQNKKGEILGFMSDAMASQVSKKLSIPREY